MHKFNSLKAIASQVASLVVVLLVSVASQAGVVKSWDLTNKTPGQLGANYGLRLNNLDNTMLMGYGSKSLIFDFDHADSNVGLQLIETNSVKELVLSGTAVGAIFSNGVVGGYGTELAGKYELDFTWRNLSIDFDGYDFLAENGIADLIVPTTQGAGTGTVKGVTAGTAFMANMLQLGDYSGNHNHTLSIKDANNPDASGWLTYTDLQGNGTGHAGDYGFNLSPVPVPAAVWLFGSALLGFAGIGKLRKSKI